MREPIYAVRAQTVIGTRAHLLTAARLRETVGLSPEQELVLLLFDDDPIIERFWAERAALIPELAAAGYRLVASPSYSGWDKRPRTDFLYQAKRSLVVFSELLAAGLCAIPRLAWQIEFDVARFAHWVDQNPSIKTVALDLMTYRRNPAWTRQLELLALFDRLTEQRLRYLVNGPGTVQRFVDVFSAVDNGRVVISNSTMGSNSTEEERRRLHPLSAKEGGSRVNLRCQINRERLAQAKQMVRATPASAEVKPLPRLQRLDQRSATSKRNRG